MYQRSRPRIVAIALIAAAFAVAGTAAAGAPRTAGWLLGRLAAQARSEAQAATAARHADDARTWTAWAGLYEQLAASPGAGKVTALAFVQANAQETRKDAAEAARYHAPAAAALHLASSRMWAVLAEELQGGGEVAIAFPRAEMLHPVPGLPGTPWASGHATTAVQKLVLCDGLASRVRSCKAQLAEMRHEQTIGLANNGDQIVVEMTMCDRLQEQLVGSCTP